MRGRSATNVQAFKDDYRVYAPGASALTDFLQFADQNLLIRGVTIVNNSTAAVTLFFNRPANVGVPDITVGAGTSQAFPAPSVQSMGVAIGSGSGGTVYLHFTTQLVSNPQVA